VLALLAGRAARADGPVVDFSFDGCEEPLPTDVERIARVELHAAKSALGPQTRIEIRCSADEVDLTGDDPITGKKVERVVSLAGVVESTRARLLALAVAELLRSSWIEVELNPVPALPLAHPVEVLPAQR
jgi:hypothetical protein